MKLLFQNLLRRKQFIFLAGLLFLGSCFTFSQSFHIYKDGSATVKISYSIDLKQYQLLLDLEQAASELEGHTSQRFDSRYFDKKRLRQHLQAFKSVAVKKLTVFDYKGRRHMSAVLHCDNLQTSLREGIFPYMFLKKNGDKAIFSCKLPYGDENSIAIREDLRNAFSFELNLHTPGKILSSNGQIDKNKRQVKWSFQGKPDVPSSFEVTFLGLK